MKNVLVPVDFSEKSLEALDVAIDLAKNNNAVINLLHYVELPTRYVTGSEVEVPETLYLINLAKEKLIDLGRQVEAKGVKVVPYLETNDIIQSIETLIEKENIELIIMGSTGATGAKEIFIGSNTEKIVRSSSVPVLVIKNKTDINSLKKMVFACDFSQKYEGAFQKAIDFARLIRAKIDFVYINTPYAFRSSREIKNLMDDFSKTHWAIHEHNIHFYDDVTIEDGIFNFAEDNQTDLICMFPAHRSGIAHFFNGSLSEDVVNHSEYPVLTIKL